MSDAQTATTEHASIGEVLAQLRDEFPDVTISKIRFLESQGLIDPERTPSGYRKFYPADVARLRWILRQQKDHFLPLKVIRERVEQIDFSSGEVPGDSDAPEPVAEEPAPAVSKRAAAKAVDPARGREPAVDAGDAAPKGRRRSRTQAPAAAAAKPVPAAALDGIAQLFPVDDGAPEPMTIGTSGVSLTRTELAQAAGVTEEAIAELEAYGLLEPAGQVGERVLFDERALTVARVAGGFATHGVEPRHLRMYKHFADREAVLFEQVVLPSLRQRNPESRTRARDTLGELSGLGRALRGAYLRAALQALLDE